MLIYVIQTSRFLHDLMSEVEIFLDFKDASLLLKCLLCHYFFILQAIIFLHEFGILLHYEDTALQLKDLYFIDPGWLCRMMAQVITVRQINPFIKNGVCFP